MKRLLLDTEALIWWDANDPRLGPRARALIRDAPQVYVSAASAWEIAIKVALGKLKTKRQPAEAVADSGFAQLPVTFEQAAAIGGLLARYNDPFDRLIIAQALAEDLKVVTRDAIFREYGVRVIW